MKWKQQKRLRESNSHRRWWLRLHKRCENCCSFKKRTNKFSTTKPPQPFLPQPWSTHKPAAHKLCHFTGSKTCKLYITIIHCDRVSLPFSHKIFYQACWQCMASFDNVSVLCGSLSTLFARSLVKQLSSTITLNPMLTRQIRSLDDGRN